MMLSRHQVYKEVTEDDLIPAHLLGNMWAQAWTQIERFLLPYPSEPTLDVTPNLKSKLKDAKGMFLEAERFFTSLGWRKLPAKFWTHSMFVEPEDRKVIIDKKRCFVSLNQRDASLYGLSRVNLQKENRF